jgi:hypothetical protein
MRREFGLSSLTSCSAAVEKTKGGVRAKLPGDSERAGGLDWKPTASKILTEFVEGFYSVGELDCCRLSYVREFSERASLLLRFRHSWAVFRGVPRRGPRHSDS